MKRKTDSKQNDTLKQMGRRIENRRKDLGITQAQLAEKLGYKSRTTIGKIEQGLNGLSHVRISAFAEALQTTPAYIMGYSDIEAEIQSANVMEIDVLFDALNDDGQRKVIEYVEMLVNSNKYKKQNASVHKKKRV